MFDIIDPWDALSLTIENHAKKKTTKAYEDKVDMINCFEGHLSSYIKYFPKGSKAWVQRLRNHIEEMRLHLYGGMV